MRIASFFVITLSGILAYVMPESGQLGICTTVHAEDAKSELPRITATEPAALVSGSTVTFRLRGFELKEATEMRFPTAAETSVEIKEAKDAAQPNGLDNKMVGNMELLAEVTLPANLPTGLLEYVVTTPAGDAIGKVMVLSADSVIDEEEPNNGFREAQELPMGRFARGSIQGNKDVDVYAIAAQAGQRLKVTVMSGGPLLMDAELNCYDSQGQFLASADDDQSRDPVLTLETQAEGTVFLCVSSAHDVGGEWHSYLLIVEDVK